MLPAFRWVPPRRGAEGRLCPGTEGSAGRGCRPVPAEGRRLLRGSLGPAGASVGLPRAAHAGGGCRGPVRFPPPQPRTGPGALPPAPAAPPPPTAAPGPRAALPCTGGSPGPGWPVPGPFPRSGHSAGEDVQDPVSSSAPLEGKAPAELGRS